MSEMLSYFGYGGSESDVAPRGMVMQLRKLCLMFNEAHVSLVTAINLTEIHAKCSTRRSQARAAICSHVLDLVQTPIAEVVLEGQVWTCNTTNYEVVKANGRFDILNLRRPTYCKSGDYNVAFVSSGTSAARP